MRRLVLVLNFIFLFFVTTSSANDELFWVKISAKNKFERTKIVNLGIPIEIIKDDYVVALVPSDDLERVKKEAPVELHFQLQDASLFDFPKDDSKFHNYYEFKTEFEDLATHNPDLVRLIKIGESHEGRDLIGLQITSNQKAALEQPAILFMGTHHAREHLSTELPILLSQYLISEYRNGNSRIRRLLDGRTTYILPMINPDGVEWDVATGNYRAWRKNRRQNADGKMGVDLNRNYGYMWNHGGSSNSPGSDIYMGPSPFSEPETQAVKTFIETHENISISVSFHSFSELILYPYGYDYKPIEVPKDLLVHETMAKKMSQWNQYKAQQSADLYIASGVTQDWTYGVHRIFSFTFELDPKWGWGSDGFYPGQGKIPLVFEKNLEPCLYMMEYADNPYRVLDSKLY